jgi:DnaJ-domain-containing protein 1
MPNYPRPYADPLTEMLNRFVEDVVFPRMEEAFDKLTENLRNPGEATQPGVKASRKKGQRRVHKAKTPKPQSRSRTRPRLEYTYYHLFEVQPGASIEVLEAAHRALAKKHHPDTAQGAAAKAQAETRMRLINAAWEVLRDPGKRRQYDREMGIR